MGMHKKMMSYGGASMKKKMMAGGGTMKKKMMSRGGKMPMATDPKTGKKKQIHNFHFFSMSHFYLSDHKI